MWKGPIINMETVYPFAAIPQHPTPPKHLVRKKIPKNGKHLDKANFLYALKHQSLIKVQSIEQEGGEHILLFEYVPQWLDKWYQSVSQEFIQNYQQRLILFSRYLADRGVLTTFKRENMGVNESGEVKYFLDTNFDIDPNVDKLSLKKKYKEQIKEQIQYYIDKKASHKNTSQSKVQLPQKKQNEKILKILQAIERGKAHLCAETPKEPAQAVVPSQNAVSTSRSGSKSKSKLQNVVIQKETNKLNKFQVIVNNMPMEVVQQEYKRQYATSSFYMNGMPTMVVQTEGGERRLLSPNDKLTRFEEVRYKEYKTMKISSEVYVQDFINVLQSDQVDKLALPGSPRSTLMVAPILHIQNPPPTISSNVPQKVPQEMPALAIEAQVKKDEQGTELKKKEANQQSAKRLIPPKTQRIADRSFVSEKRIISPCNLDSSTIIKSSCEGRGGISNKANELQKKVSEAIANSLSVINKFKSAKNQVS